MQASQGSQRPALHEELADEHEVDLMIWFIILDELGPGTLFICPDCGAESYHPIAKCQCACERTLEPRPLVWPLR